MTDADDQTIRDRLRELLPNSYAPYSNFRVAAAAIDEHGRAHYGVNVENQSFPVATCAEAAAIAALRVAGGDRIKKLYLCSDPDVEVVPCGACRQRLAELGDSDTVVISLLGNGRQSTFTLAELFPHAFRFK